MSETSNHLRGGSFRPWIAGLCLALASPILALDSASGEDDGGGAAGAEADHDAHRSIGAESPGTRSPRERRHSEAELLLRYPFGPVVCPPFDGLDGVGPTGSPDARRERGRSRSCWLRQCSKQRRASRLERRPIPTTRATRDRPADEDDSEASGASETAVHLCPPAAIRPEDSAPDRQPPAQTTPTPEDSLAPTNHDVDWLERHGDVARSSSDQCTDCHTEDDCASCHDEKRAEPYSVHPPNFDTLHAVKARGQERDCADCHNVDTFCTRCHTRADVAPRPSADPPARYDVHPDDWTDPDAPRNHAVMARRNIEDCASCHTERDCTTCHESVNPHPPEFRLKCEDWLAANPRPCTKCHQDLDRLERRCL